MSERERWDSFYDQPLNESELGRFPKAENHASLIKAVEDLARWTAWGGDYAHGGQFHSGPADTLGDIDEFLSDIVGAVGAGTHDIFESYDPLLYTVANVVNETILGMLDHMTDEQIAAYNEDYCRSLERRG